MFSDKTHIIFDAFWTLIETSWAEKYYRKSLAILNKYWWIKKLKLLTNKYPSFPNAYFQAILKQLNVNNFDVIDELILLFEQEKKFYRLKPYAKELLELLSWKWKKLYVASNLSSLYVPVADKLFDWLPIDKIYYSCEIWLKKNVNDLSFYNYILKDLQIKPEQVIFTGDSLENDVIGPSKLGIKSFLIEEFLKQCKIKN